MPDLRVLVANCLLGGDRITQREDSWIRNIVEFDCAGRSVLFTQRDEVAKGNGRSFVGQFCETSDVLIRDVAECDLNKSLTTIDHLCWILSFASMSKVLWYGYDYPAGSPNCYRRSVVGAVNDFRPVFDLRDVGSVQGFVKQVYSGYKRLARPRKLSVVIDYLVRAEEPNQATEVRLLLAFVALESLKDTYARSKSIPYIRGFYRKGPNASSLRYTFQELLEAMLREVRMRKGLKTIIRLRNELIHSGLSRLPHRSQWMIYERTQDLIREYLLRVFGYRGSYFTHASGGNALRAV